MTNSDGKIFTVSSPFEIGVFQNVVGTFDEKELKIYVNGYLINRNKFNGSYNANPDVSLNVGLNSYDYGGPWTGLMDESRFYDRAISEIEVQKLADYRTYTRYFRASNDDGLSGYWPFDQGLMDKSGNGNDGKIIPPSCKHGLFTRWETFLFCQGCRGDKNCEANPYGLDRTVCPAARSGYRCSPGDTRNYSRS